MSVVSDREMAATDFYADFASGTVANVNLNNVNREYIKFALGLYKVSAYQLPLNHPQYKSYKNGGYGHGVDRRAEFTPFVINMDFNASKANLIKVFKQVYSRKDYKRVYSVDKHFNIKDFKNRNVTPYITNNEVSHENFTVIRWSIFAVLGLVFYVSTFL